MNIGESRTEKPQSLMGRYGVSTLGTLFITLHLFIIFGLGNCSALAPDEQTYLSVFFKTYHPVSGEPAFSWGDASHPFLLVQYLPARIFQIIGFAPIYALRLTSLVFVLTTIFLLYQTGKQILSSQSIKINKVAIYLTLSILLLPSLMMWTSLGLRESLLYAEIALFIYGITRISSRHFLAGNFYSSIALIGLLNTKFYLAILFMGAFGLAWLVFFFKSSNKRTHFFFLFILVLPLALNFSKITSVAFPSVSNTRPISSDSVGSSTSSSTSSNTGSSATSIETKSTTAVAFQQCLDNHSGGFLATLIAHKLGLHPQAVTQPSAQPAPTHSSIAPTTAPTTQPTPTHSTTAPTAQPTPAASTSQNTGVGGVKQNSQKQAATDIFSVSTAAKFHDPKFIIQNIFRFLTEPFPFTASASTSAANQLYSFETILWIFIYLLTIYVLFKNRKKAWSFIELVLGFMVLSFIIFSAETEINLGTALRHRSIIVIPVILLIFLRNNSFENLVKSET